MNKKIILLSLITINSAFATDQSQWEKFRDHVRQNSGKWITGLVAVATAGAYALFNKPKEAAEQEAPQDARQKFLNMLTKAIESDIFRLDCALREKMAAHMKFDVVHVWENATANADEHYSELYNHVRVVKNFETYLRYEKDVLKAKEVLTNFRDAIKEARNRK